MNFSDMLEQENNKTLTQNCDITYKSSLNKVLDFFVTSGNVKNSDEADAILKSHFIPSFYSDPINTIKVLFYARDIRQGMGRRQIFRTCFSYLLNLRDKTINSKLLNILYLIPEFGRWDDLIVPVFKSNNNFIINKTYEIIKRQLDEDIRNMNNNENISLLSKFLPSLKTSGPKEKRELSSKIITKLKYDMMKNDSIIIENYSNINKKLNNKYNLKTRIWYKKTLAKLRKYLNIVERNMSDKNFNKIIYSEVPSIASKKYHKAFERNDYERYTKYLENVSEGKEKINVSTLYPYEIIKPFFNNSYYISDMDDKDEKFYDLLWKKYLENNKNIELNSAVVVDVSGSMFWGNSKILPIHVALSLGLYTAEKMEGIFHNKIITFSENAEFINLNDIPKLKDKLNYIFQQKVGFNTNIRSVYSLILNTAIKNNLPKEDMLKNIIIVSDMQFDQATPYNNKYTETTHNIVKKEFNDNGYDLPNIIYWNVSDIENAVFPVVKDESYAKLISGFSPKIFEYMICENFEKLSPIEFMMEILNSERYKNIIF